MSRNLGQGGLQLAKLALMGALASGCAASQVGTPPPAPVTELHGAEIMPADLDVVVRLDLERIRSALGPELITLLAEQGAEESRPLLTRALENSDLLWLGWRPGLAPELSDNVVVLRGDHTDLELTGEEGFGPATDLGGSWFRYDRKDVKVRAAPARAYRLGAELLVLVSTAEIDAVERSLEQSSDDPRLEPRASGLLSLVARGGAVRAALERYPMVGGLVAGISELRGEVDWSLPLLKVELELRFVDEKAAKRAEEGIAGARDRLSEGSDMTGFVVSQLKVERVGPAVVLRLELPRKIALGLVGCALGLPSCE